MANWIRDSEPMESIRVSFRADPYRDQAVHQALSKLPSLDGIRAQLLSLLSTPASQFVRLLDAKRQKDETAA